MRKKLLTLFLISSLWVAGQDSNLGNWMIYFGNLELNSRWNWHNEVQYRNYNAAGDLEQLLLRTGIGCNLSENNNNLLLGYGYILSENYGPDSNEKTSVQEHRIYQQFINRHPLGRLSVQHRFRFEQRFIESNYKMRLRYFLALNYPLNNSSMEDHTLYLSAYNELFINVEPEAFDRDRVYGGLGYRFSAKLRVELAYMNQFFGSGSRDQINMVCFLNL